LSFTSLAKKAKATVDLKKTLEDTAKEKAKDEKNKITEKSKDD